MTSLCDTAYLRTAAHIFDTSGDGTAWAYFSVHLGSRMGELDDLSDGELDSLLSAELARDPSAETRAAFQRCVQR